MQANRQSSGPERSTRKPSSAPKSVTTSLTNPKVTPNPSPARDLQHRLMNMFASPLYGLTTATDERRVPLKWTLVALALFCGAFWAMVALLIF